MARANDWVAFKFGLVRGYRSALNDIYVVGIYDKDTFSGTDKLSMAVQPVLLKMIESMSTGTILFEGDRLFNQSLFDAHPVEIHVLTADPGVIDRNHHNRGDNQSEQFISNKRTKISNIITRNICTIHTHETPEDTERIADLIFNRATLTKADT